MPNQRALVSVDDLIRTGLAAPQDAALLERVADSFRIRVSPAMQQAIAPGVPADDPVARQFVPSPQELLVRPEELHDPIGDEIHSPVRGLTHRYPDRVILHVTQTCEVYCRFCFRRETVGDDGALPDADLAAALDYIRSTPAVWEVILTGGDPLVLSPRRLGAIMEALAGIDHVGVVRIHSRIPVVAPQRVTDDLIGALRAFPTVYIVIHTNHANEITDAAAAAMARLSAAGLPLLAQTVLLRGVNDSAAALAALFRCLIRHRIKPYYLHHCDLARGTGHFRTTLAEGQRIMTELRGRLSGICLPTYVLDIPGGHGKVPIGPGHVRDDGNGSHTVTDPRGGQHRYDDPAR